MNFIRRRGKESAVLLHNAVPLPSVRVLGWSAILPWQWSSYSITLEIIWFSEQTWYSWRLAGASACNCCSALWEPTLLVGSVYVIFVSADRARLPQKCAAAFPSHSHLEAALVFGHNQINSISLRLYAVSCLWEQFGFPDAVWGLLTCRIPWKLLNSVLWLF